MKMFTCILIRWLVFTIFEQCLILTTGDYTLRQEFELYQFE